jgi:16S rRNA (uracil1498-N3)-methyltransferase
MNLLLIQSEEMISTDVAEIKGRRAEHMIKILKVAISDIIKVGLLDGLKGDGEIISIENKTVRVKLDLHTEPPPPLPLNLVIAMQRPQTFKKVLECAGAMGVKQIYALHCNKVEKSYWDSPLLKDHAFEKHLLLGLEQSGDTVMPQVHFERRFRPFVEDSLPKIAQGTTALVAHPGMPDICPAGVAGPVTLCIGPEGGFTEYEVEKLTQAGCLPVSIGQRILRTEFALASLFGRLFT